LRNYVTFAHPSIEEDKCDSHGELLPRGSEILAAVRDKMGERGSLVTEIEEHDGYGWCFYTEVDGTRVWSMLQFCEPWLLIVEVPLRWLQRLKGKRVDELQERVCRDIHEVLKAMPQARNVQWFTPSEFQRSEGRGGAPAP
jgi:hypothetical protein